MKRNRTNIISRRYFRTCCQLKYFLLDQIHEADWLHPDTIKVLKKDILNIEIRDGALEQLWEVASCIAEAMVDCDVEDHIFYSFIQKSMLIRLRGEYNEFS